MDFNKIWWLMWSLCPQSALTLDNLSIKMNEKSYNGKTLKKSLSIAIILSKNKTLSIKVLNI